MSSREKDNLYTLMIWNLRIVPIKNYYCRYLVILKKCFQKKEEKSEKKGIYGFSALIETWSDFCDDVCYNIVRFETFEILIIIF